MIAALALALALHPVAAAVNDVRSPDVTRGACLTATAQAYANRLAATQDYRHSRVPALLPRCRMQWVGEVLARTHSGPVSPSVVVQAWLDSPDHRAVVRAPQAERIGVGTATASDGTWYVVVHMGNPR